MTNEVEQNVELAAAIRACVRCPLAGLRDGVAVSADVGKRYNGLAIMGEVPSAQEAAVGVPFVGPVGRILSQLLGDVGLTRDEIVVLNRVRCRPPRNDLKSHPEAVEACDEWTVAELTEYNPRVVVLVGATAIGSIFGASATVGETRGSVRSTGASFKYGQRLWVPTYQPASLMPHRRPQNRPLVVADLMLAKELLMDSTNGTTDAGT